MSRKIQERVERLLSESVGGEDLLYRFEDAMREWLDELMVELDPEDHDIYNIDGSGAIMTFDLRFGDTGVGSRRTDQFPLVSVEARLDTSSMDAHDGPAFVIERAHSIAVAAGGGRISGGMVKLIWGREEVFQADSPKRLAIDIYKLLLKELRRNGIDPEA